MSLKMIVPFLAVILAVESAGPVGGPVRGPVGGVGGPVGGVGGPVRGPVGGVGGPVGGVGGPVGGVVDAKMDEGARNALQFAVAEYNRQSNDAFVYRVSKVIKVQTQVVSGMNYFFTVIMARTGCRKGAVRNLCVIHLAPKQVTQCKITVWSQPWLNSMKVTEYTCM